MARAKRRPDRQLAVAARGAHQKQTRDVCTRDKQEHDDASLQYVEGCAGVADQLVAE